MSSRLGFSSWLYQLEEFVRLGVAGRLPVDERLGGRIVEVEEEDRLWVGEGVRVLVVVMEDMIFVGGSGLP